MSTLTLDRLSKRYSSDDREVVAVDSLSLDVGDGELLVLVGPSGCGKSTALRMIAGLEEITGGELTIDGQRMNERDSSQRDIAMVFQNYALYPHMSVYRNIAYPLRIQKKSKAEIDARVRETARILQLTDLLDRRPGALSGGQRQRVAMGRALIRRPKAFLMDEPLSNLDAKLRVQMRAEITAIQRQINVTTVYVTHDQVEAMTMGDRVAVMRDGVLQQVATPTELFWWPANTFVASFIGSPPMNLFAATAQKSGTGMDITIGAHALSLSKDDLASHPGLAARGSGPVIVGMRPEHLGLVADEAQGPTVRGRVIMVEHLGTELICHADIGGDRLTEEDLEVEEDAVAVAGNALVARIQSKAPLQVGARVTFSVDAAELRFFDPETNYALR